MTKAKLIEIIHGKTGFPKRDVALIIESMIDIMKESLLRKEKISLKGFGIFKVKTRKARVGRNPRTKEEVRIPERDVVVFEPSKQIRVIK
jgi:nucleoid DNA-binding protein